MEKDNKRYSVFESQDIVSNLKKGRNPLPKRIKNLDSYKTMIWYDSITGDCYQYTPSHKRQYDGKPLGYSFECLYLRDGATYVREIAEYSDDRSKDKYRINGEYVTREEFFDEIYVTREEFFDEMSRLSLKQNDRDVQHAMNTVLKMDTTKNNKLEVIKELLSHRNIEVVISCIRSMELDLEAKDLVKKAIELEKQSSESHDRKLLDEAVQLYIDSEILKRQSDVEFQRAKLQDFFADVKDNSDKFRSKLSNLMADHYFTNFENTEYGEIGEFLDVVFSTKGLNDVIEFLLKMKEARIEYSDALLPDMYAPNGIPFLAPSMTQFQYETSSTAQVLNLECVKINILNISDDELKRRAKWCEFSRILEQPLTKNGRKDVQYARVSTRDSETEVEELLNSGWSKKRDV